MKLFTVGPVEMYPFTLKTAAGQIPYFRTKEFSAMMLESEELLKKQMHAPDTSRLVFLTASAPVQWKRPYSICSTRTTVC